MALLRNETCNLRHSIHLRHPVPLNETCVPPHSYVWRHSFKCATHPATCTATHTQHRHSYVWRDSLKCATHPATHTATHTASHTATHTATQTATQTFIRVTWLLQICNMTQSHVWRDACTCVTCVLQCVLQCAALIAHTVHKTYLPQHMATISRLLKLQVSFAEYRLFHRALCKRDL